MAQTLQNVIDFSQAPVFQWEPVIGAAPTAAKAQEDRMIYPEILSELVKENARYITGFVADEGRLETYIDAKMPAAVQINHLTIQGAFENAAQKNIRDAAEITPFAAVKLVTDIDSIAPASQDVVIMSLILDCVANSQSVENIENLLLLASTYLKPGGKLITVRPNPELGAGGTYACITPPSLLKPGKDFTFVVRGLESMNAMQNIYTPDAFLQPLFNKAGLKLGETKPIADRAFNDNKPSKKPAFLLNVSPKI